MRDYRLRRAALACLTLACALAVVVPGHAAPPPVEGTVLLPALGPALGPLSAEQLHTLSPGTFGYLFPVPSVWVGKSFTLTYPRQNEIVSPGVYVVDLDVYFHSSSVFQNGYPWDDETGNNPGPESGTIPATTDKAYVRLSYTTPAGGINTNPDTISSQGVPFTFTVTY